MANSTYLDEFMKTRSVTIQEFEDLKARFEQMQETLNSIELHIKILKSVILQEDLEDNTLIDNDSSDNSSTN